jgi:hypothetical protein
MNGTDAELWEEAKNEELVALRAKGVYTECDLPLGKHALLSKGVLDLKKDAKVNIERYKYRLVALGYRQVDRRDYQEVFAPTALSATLKILLAVAAADGLELRQADVKTAFLNGNLEEEVYLKPPPEAGNGEKVWRLSKALYGLKQAAS